jgi:hypothetical protein
MDAKKYKYFQGHYNINLIGIRTECSESNKFDDTFIVSYQSRQKEFILGFPCTTDPGKKYLLNPLAGTGGTLIMVPGQYRAAYELGIHGRSKPKEKQYEALEQVKDICYVRDKSRDSVIDFNLYRGADRPVNIFWDNCKSNIHRGNSGWLSKVKGQHLVDGHSAGCQVLQYSDDFTVLLSLVRKSIAVWGNGFTYTLLEERDFLLV